MEEIKKVRVCIQCGKEVDNKAKFCPKCGSAMTGETKEEQKLQHWLTKKKKVFLNLK